MPIRMSVRLDTSLHREFASRVDRGRRDPLIRGLIQLALRAIDSDPDAIWRITYGDYQLIRRTEDAQ